MYKLINSEINLRIIVYFIQIHNYNYSIKMTTDFCPQNKHKIILVGDAGTGKTSLFWRYIKNQLPENHLVTTIDFRYKTIQLP